MNSIIPQSATGIGGSSHLNYSQTATANAEQQSALSEELERIASVLCEHEAIIERLADRLEPVSLPVMPASDGKHPTEPPHPMSSVVVRMIREQRERIQRQSAILCDLIHRQQVR